MGPAARPGGRFRGSPARGSLGGETLHTAARTAARRAAKETGESRGASSSRRSAFFAVVSAAIAALLALLLIPAARRPARLDSTLAVCAAVRDSPENVLEWVRYHHDRSIGVGKFYLMVTDDPDVSAMQKALEQYIDRSIVELYDLPYVNPRTVSQLQVKLYEKCLDSVRALHDFVGFWDVDEFVVRSNAAVPPFSQYLSEMMKSHGNTSMGGLALNWRIVGPSGHVTKPSSGGVLENYRMCTPWTYAENEEIKSVVRTAHAVRPLSDPHTFEYREGYHAVDCEMRPVDGGRHPAGVRDPPPKYALYHFVTKSREDYQEKMRRGSAMGNRKAWEYFDTIERLAIEPCVPVVAA
jgi:hypothetical protein